MGFLSTLVPASLRRLLGDSPIRTHKGYQTFTESAPSFSSWDGTIYEMARTRAIVERIATSCSKLKPEFVTPDGKDGAAPRIQRLFATWPNEFMTWPDFLQRLATTLFVDTTAYVVPQYDADLNIVGLFPLKPSWADVVEHDGEPYIVFHLHTGEIQAFWFYEVAIITRFQLESDIFGGGNVPLTSTLRLMDAQRQAEELALKNGARIRFIGKLVGLVHPDEMDRKREKFGRANLGPANTSGLMVYDNTWEEIKQIQEQHYTIDADEMERIDKTLYTYFGINEHILTNDYTEEQWGAFYEGVIEPFAIRLGEALTKMLLTQTQRKHGNYIMFSSSYLEYATPRTKLSVTSGMLDRGVMSVNQALDIWQLPHIRGGDVRMVRGEIYIIDEDNNIIAESGGHNSDGNALSEPDDEPPDDDPDGPDGIDPPDEPDDDGQLRALTTKAQTPEGELGLSLIEPLSPVEGELTSDGGADSNAVPPV